MASSCRSVKPCISVWYKSCKALLSKLGGSFKCIKQGIWCMQHNTPFFFLFLSFCLFFVFIDGLQINQASCMEAVMSDPIPKRNLQQCYKLVCLPTSKSIEKDKYWAKDANLYFFHGMSLAMSKHPNIVCSFQLYLMGLSLSCWMITHMSYGIIM